MNVGASLKSKAAKVAALGATADIAASALSTTNTYTDAAVNAQIDTTAGEIEARLDAIEAKLDELIAALSS